MQNKSKRATVSLVILVLLVMLALNLSLTAAAVSLPADPGGIGTTNLTAWFDANSGAFGDVACSGAVTAGETVACWVDQGPNGLQAKQNGVGKRATWESDQLNGLPVVRFDSPPSNNDDLGTGSDSIDSLGTAFPTTDATVFVVQRADVLQDQSTFAAAPAGASNEFSGSIPWGDYAVHWDMGDSAGTGRLSYSSFSDTTSFYLWGFETDSTSGQTIWQSGEEKASDGTAGTFDPTDKELFVGAASVAKERFSGDIAELIIYNAALPELDRSHVELYLRDKYDLDLSDSGIYTAPPAYHHNVRGISQSAHTPNSDRHSDTAGLRVVNFSFLQEDDDALVFGHNNAPFNCCVEDGLADSGATIRWARLWSFDVNDDTSVNVGGRVDLTFDISDASGEGTFNGAGKYFLLKRNTNSTDNFSDVPLVSTTIAGDKVIFRVQVTHLGSEFTIGEYTTITAVGLDSFSGKSGPSPFVLAGLIVLMLITVAITITRRQVNGRS